MADDPKSIATMKRYYGDRFAVPTGEDMMAEMVESNDRSCIITVASLVDAALESLLAGQLPRVRKMEQKEFENAFRHDGPFGTFSYRLEVSYCMEIIDYVLYRQINDLRTMRNAVAHTKRRVTFEDDELKNVAKRLFHPIGKFPLLDETPEGYRRTLVAEGNLIYNSLAYGRDEAIRLIRKAFIDDGKQPPF